MNPLKFKMAMDYLTRIKKVKPDLPDVFPASQAPIPPKKESIKTMEAINRFVRDNPRQQKAGGGMLVQPGFGGVRQGYSGEYGPNIRKATKTDSFEVQGVRGGKGGGKGGQKFYKTFNFDKYGGEKKALKAAKEYRDSFLNIKKDIGKFSKGRPVGFKSTTGGQAEIRKALNDIIKAGGKSFSNEDIRKLVDMDLFPDDDQFRKAVDVVKKEPEFKNLTFNKKPRPRLSDDPVSVLQAKTRKKRKKKLDLLGSREYEKELYNFKKEVQEGLGLEPIKTTGAISGKPREFLPIDMGHQSSIDQLKLLKQKLRPEDLGPQFYRANREGIRKFEGGVRTLEDNLKKKFYPEQKKLYNKAKKFVDAGQEIPADLQNKIINSNEKIQIFIDKTVEKYPLLKNRVNAITIDANDLTVKRGGDVSKQLGIGLVDQDLGNIKIGSLDDLTIKANLAEQTLREATDAGLIDKNIGRQRLDKFLNVRTLENSDQIRLARIGCPGKATGGRVGYFEGQNLTACAAKGVEKLQGDPGKLTPGDQANLRTLGKSAKAVKFLKGVLGPGAILGEVLFEGGAAANKFMDQGMPIKQALGESYINKYLLGPKLQIDVEAERAKEFAKGEDFAMAERGKRMAPFMAQSKEADARRLKERQEQMEQAFPTTSISDIQTGLNLAGITQQDTGMTFPQIQDFLKQQDQMQAIADAGGVANLAGGGIAKLAGVDSGPPPASGPNSQGLQGLMKRVKRI